MKIEFTVLCLLIVFTFADTNFLVSQESFSKDRLTLKKLNKIISDAEELSKMKNNFDFSLSSRSKFTSISEIAQSDLSNSLSGNVILKNTLRNYQSNQEFPFRKTKSASRYSKDFSDAYKPWESERHFALGVSEGIFLNILIPWTLARYGRDWDSPDAEERWPFIGFQSIWHNLESGWNYDGDNFLTNMFSHPYGGNLFYNSGRSNGFNFWESSAFALGGSYIWETFMETNQPAINDWVNTGLGGAAFGEILYRLSTLITDNEARGGHRVWTEIAGGIVNPARLLTRLITGEASKVFPNPEWRTPGKLNLSLDAGTRILFEDSTDLKELQGLFELTINYGDPFRLKHSTPFSRFYYNLTIASSYPSLTSMNAIGSLFAFELGKSKTSGHSLETTLNYDYINNPGFLYGNIAFTEQLNSYFDLNKNWKLMTRIGARLIPMGGTPNDYFLDETDGRNYDFGQALGAVGSISLFNGAWNILTVQYAYDYLWTQSEPSYSEHKLQGGALVLQLPIKDYFIFGVGAGYYKRQSNYNYPSGYFNYPTPDVTFDTPIVRVFFKTRII